MVLRKAGQAPGVDTDFGHGRLLSLGEFQAHGGADVDRTAGVLQAPVAASRAKMLMRSAFWLATQRYRPRGRQGQFRGVAPPQGVKPRLVSRPSLDRRQRPKRCHT